MKSVETKNFSLFLGDARELVLADKVDLVVSDPPYRLVAGGQTSRGMTGGFIDDYNNNGEIVPCDIEWNEIAKIIYESLKDDTHAYVMCNNRHVEDMLREHREAGLDFHNLLIWDKRSATANRWYMKNLEYIGFFKKGKAKPINDCSSMQLVSMYQYDETNHPTEKPVELMKYYIKNSSNEGDTVFDPFVGSGSTGVAAIKAGRKFIGVEKDERYFDIALSRLKDAEQNIQEELF